MNDCRSKRRFAVIGTPIEHSLSAMLHTAVFRELGLPWQTVNVDPETSEGFRRVIDDIRAGVMNYGGANVTIPYKDEAYRLCDVLSPLAQRCGAVNTLCRQEDGTLMGRNTDVEGFLVSLKSELGLDASHLGSAVICGTGGAARAVAAGLAGAGVPKLVILSRTDNRASQFVADLSRDEDRTVWSGASYLEAFSVMDPNETFDLCVNATPLGMVDNSAEDMPPGWFAWLKQHARAIFDVVYRRNDLTLLVQWAHQIGIPATDGLQMLVEQAIRSLAFWDVPADPDEMRAIMKQALVDEGIVRCAQNQKKKQKRRP